MTNFLKIATFLFLLVPKAMFGQDTTYYNSDGIKVKNSLQAEYYQTLVKENITLKKLIERNYYMNGKMREEIYYLDLSPKKKEGTQRFWFKNGQLKISTDYVDNKIHGNVQTYWPNGKLKRQDTFENNKYIAGTCYDSIGNKVEHFDFLVYPSFPGGEKMLLEYLRNNIRYPSVAAEDHLEGKVVVKFIIGKDGTPIHISLKTGVDRALDKEALRVVRAMPKWTPFILDGEQINFWYTLPIIFRMM